MARFQAAAPNGVALQQLEVLGRRAVFQSANQVVAYIWCSKPPTASTRPTSPNQAGSARPERN